MCKVVIAKTNQISHEDWLKLRLKGIGGSDAAAVCGMSRYSSPLDVWLMKTGKKAAEPDNDKMHFGRLLEPIIRGEFARRTGFKAQECPYMFAFKEFPFMIANIDGAVTESNGTKALPEIKTTNSATTMKDLEDGLPIEYFFQVQHYLAVTNLKKAYVAALTGGNNFQIQRVERDEEVIETIIALESTFWTEYVAKDEGVIPASQIQTPPTTEKTPGKPALLKAGAEHLASIYGFRTTSEIVSMGYGSANTQERKFVKQGFAASLNVVLKIARKRSFVDAVLTATSVSRIFIQDIEELKELAATIEVTPDGQRSVN